MFIGSILHDDQHNETFNDTLRKGIKKEILFYLNLQV